MESALRGVVRGRTVELVQESGLPDGQEVTVILNPVRPISSGEGLRRAFGAWANDAEELEQFLEWNRQQRKAGRRGIGD